MQKGGLSQSNALTRQDLLLLPCQCEAATDHWVKTVHVIHRPMTLLSPDVRSCFGILSFLICKTF